MSGFTIGQDSISRLISNRVQLHHYSETKVLPLLSKRKRSQNSSYLLKWLLEIYGKD